MIDQETLDSVGGGVVLIVQSPGGAKWWQSYRVGAAPIVADYLDRRIADPGDIQLTWDELWPYWARWVSEDRADGESADKAVVERQT